MSTLFLHLCQPGKYAEFIIIMKFKKPVSESFLLSASTILHTGKAKTIELIRICLPGIRLVGEDKSKGHFRAVAQL